MLSPFCSGTKAPSLESATLTDPAGPVEVRTVGGETGEVGSYLTGAIVIPVKPLAPNTTYTAEVTLAPNGELPAEQHRWTFRTGPANPSGVWPLGRGSPRDALPPQRRISKLRDHPEGVHGRQTPPRRADHLPRLGQRQLASSSTEAAPACSWGRNAPPPQAPRTADDAPACHVSIRSATATVPAETRCG